MKQELLQTEYSNKMVNIFMYVVIVLLTFLIIFFNLFSLCTVKGASMENTLINNQRVLLFKKKNAKVDDIIVFKGDNYDFAKELIIKRVIATSGEKFVFASLGQESTSPLYIYINSSDGFKLINEDNRNIKVQADYTHKGSMFKVLKIDSLAEILSNIPNEGYINTVPKNSYFVLGDNRNNSEDSRNHGFINKKDIVGIVVLQIEPKSAQEKFFKFIYGDTKKDLLSLYSMKKGELYND